MLEVRNLCVTFGVTPAVRGVSFTLAPGEILGIVGESGSGKSATVMALPRILPPSASVSGEALFQGRDLLQLGENEMRRVRGAGIAMIFQEPMSALNPVMTIGRQVAEAVREGHPQTVALEMLKQVAIPEPERRMKQYPHHLSGGMRQRVMIAMALAGRPSLLIADEPTTALDVTIQAQILALLKELRERLRLAILLITHDLAVAAETADRVAVMYAGRIVETGAIREVLEAPAHPYTRGLLRVAPTLEAARPGRLPAIPGAMPAPDALPRGCSFEPRCDARIPPCTGAVPDLVPIAPNRAARCIRAAEVVSGRA